MKDAALSTVAVRAAALNFEINCVVINTAALNTVGVKAATLVCSFS